MMEVFLLSFVVILLSVGGMALGVLLGRAPLRRGCAGRGTPRDACGSCEESRLTRGAAETEAVRWRQ